MFPRRKMTLNKTVIFEGRGIHSGRLVKMECRPAAPEEGIYFIRTDLSGAPRTRLKDYHPDNENMGRGRCSTLGDPEAGVQTVEHFMAAVWALGLSDMAVHINGPEVPALDGSAVDFFNGLKSTGTVESNIQRPCVKLSEPLFVSGEKTAILALPHDGLRITFTMDQDQPGLRSQTVSFDLDETIFAAEIAPARTFCAASEAERLLELGFGKGASTDNTLVVEAEGPRGNIYRFENECARHKVLDLIGDLSLTGTDLRAHVIAVRGGHALNHRLNALILKQKEGKE